MLYIYLMIWNESYKLKCEHSYKNWYIARAQTDIAVVIWCQAKINPS